MTTHIEGWAGFDFDGVLAVCDRWRGDEHLGKPVPLMIRRVQNYLERGIKCKVFTARVSEEEGRDVERCRRLIEDWTEAHIGTRLEVTNMKDRGMLQLFDDRCIQVIKNTGKIVINTREKK